MQVLAGAAACAGVQRSSVAQHVLVCLLPVWAAATSWSNTKRLSLPALSRFGTRGVCENAQASLNPVDRRVDAGSLQ